MNKSKKIIIACNCFLSASIAQLKIGTNPNKVNASAILELETNSKGALFPRLITSQRNAMVNVIPDTLICITQIN